RRDHAGHDGWRPRASPAPQPAGAAHRVHLRVWTPFDDAAERARCHGDSAREAVHLGSAPVVGPRRTRHHESERSLRGPGTRHMPTITDQKEELLRNLTRLGVGLMELVTSIRDQIAVIDPERQVVAV